MATGEPIKLHRQRPSWLKVKAPWGETYSDVKKMVGDLALNTVCEEANCPNIGECWGHGTATFMILGDTCTRACRFCAVKTGNPAGHIDWEEPYRVADAIEEMDLTYVVITSVDRDDLPDGGAAVFAETVRAVHRNCPETIVEVLTPDFQGKLADMGKIVEAKPKVIAQNVETVRRLTYVVRDKRAGYDQTMKVLQGVKAMDPEIYTKSSIMLGFDEEDHEVLETMQDLRDHDVDLLTLGQYLRPTRKKQHLPVQNHVTPEKFDWFKEKGQEMGFLYIASGPLVRSSYKAWEAAMLFGEEERRKIAG